MDSSKHEVVTAIKSVPIIQQLASDAARWQEDKYALPTKKPINQPIRRVEIPPTNFTLHDIFSFLGIAQPNSI